jgi:methylenetetrahydrofolate reductase (NADPH)
MTTQLKTLENILNSGNFAITAEIPPPVSAGPLELESKIDLLTGSVHAINLTDNAGANAHMSSLAAASIVLNKGIDPIYQITCRDRNRLAIQSDLMGASALGIRNVLALGGDPIKSGNQPDAKAVFDVNSKTVLNILNDMNKKGLTMGGRELATKADFFPGAAAIVHDPIENWKPAALEAKASGGAKFIQTQFCYDADLLKKYMKYIVDSGLSEKLYFLVGIGPIKSEKSAKWMQDKLFGTVIPAELIHRMEQTKDPIQEGINICAELIDEFREIPGINGVHLMAPRNLTAIAPTIARTGIKI